MPLRQGALASVYQGFSGFDQGVELCSASLADQPSCNIVRRIACAGESGNAERRRYGKAGSTDPVFTACNQQNTLCIDLKIIGGAAALAGLL